MDEIIGFWNPKHLTKYLAWKYLNFSKNRTTINQRILMLKKAGISFDPKRRPRRALLQSAAVIRERLYSVGGSVAPETSVSGKATM